MRAYKLVLLASVLGLLTLVPLNIWSADENAQADEAVLKGNNVDPTDEGLSNFFKTRTLKDEDRKNIEQLVKDLGDKKFKVRESASRKLVLLGTPALRFLRDGIANEDLEISRRSKEAINAIERGPGPGLPAAAVRTVVRKHTPDRKETPEALQMLLNYFPFSDDEYVELEVLNALGTLGFKAGKLDPILEAGLKDTVSQRRSAVAFVLARFGDQEQRGHIRQLLSDTDARVRDYTAKGLLGERYIKPTADDLAGDEKIVKGAGFETDANGLIAFLKKRTLSDEDRQRIEKMVQQLGDGKYKVRETASKELVKEGPSALPFLKEAVNSADLEVSNRAKRCLAEIDRGPGPALPTAVARLLLDRKPPEAVQLLVNYLPFADDDAVEEEIITALCVLSVQDAKVDPSLVAALKDSLSPRRAGAAYVLALVGTKEHCEMAKPLLNEGNVKVRWRAAQGLLLAKEKDAVRALIGLLLDAPQNSLWQVEELLQKVGGERSPEVAVADGSEAERKKANDAWASWWKSNQATVELTRLEQGSRMLGMTIVAELDSNRVWEYGPDGKMRWEFVNQAMGPIDAHFLPGGRILVAEHNAMRVTERDQKGKELWSYTTNNQNPVAVQRLPNGNTFIATYNSVIEITKDKKEVLNVNVNGMGRGFSIYGAHKMKNGHILCVGHQNYVLELNEKGAEVRKIPIPNNGGWASVEGLPNGNYLVALTNANKVVEVDAAGKIKWEAQCESPAHAQRLPNGRTLVPCMNHRKIVELDNGGKKVAEIAVNGRPFHAHRR